MNHQYDTVSHQNRQSVEKLKDTYLHWTHNQLKKLHEMLEVLNDADPGSHEEEIQEIYEHSHNIKGLGGSFGYFLMTDIAASLCSYITHLEEPTDSTVSVITAHVHAMDVVINEEIEGTGGEQGNRIIVQLQELVKSADQ